MQGSRVELNERVVLMYSKDELEQELSSHLINSGMTYNAEDASKPVITRELQLTELVSSVIDYLERAGYVTLRTTR